VDDEFLFSSNSLTDVFRARSADAEHEIDNWDPGYLLKTPDSEIMDYLVGKYELTCPVLRRDQLEQEPVSEEVRTVTGQFSGQPAEQRLTKIIVVVAFDGEPDVFGLQPSSLTLNPPRAHVDAAQGELRLTWLGDPQAGRNAAAIRQHFDTLLDSIEQYLKWSCADIEGHNARLRAQISYRLAQRKHRLLADRQLATDLGFRIRRTPDAADYAVPVTRSKIVTPRRPSASSAASAEPFLADTQYEEALAVLRNARNALERSPSLTATMSEETIRDLFLVFLNAHFEGAAAGEVFNAHGKTDILIRVEDRNVLIECKIWAGPKKFSEAIDQLLGYLMWRDTKAALILFMRTGQPTEIIAKAISEIEGHPNYIRSVARGEDGERYDFVLHPASDPDQEIRLAFLPFALQDR